MTFMCWKSFSAWPNVAKVVKKWSRRCAGLAGRCCLEGDGCWRLVQRWLGSAAVYRVSVSQSDAGSAGELQPSLSNHRADSCVGERSACVSNRVQRWHESHNAARTNGLVGDFTFAARPKDQPELLSTLFFYLPPVPNVALRTDGEGRIDILPWQSTVSD